MVRLKVSKLSVRATKGSRLRAIMIRRGFWAPSFINTKKYIKEPRGIMLLSNLCEGRQFRDCRGFRARGFGLRA